MAYLGQERQITDWLHSMGIVAPTEDSVRRVVIDVEVGALVRVYVERYGEKSIMAAIPPNLSANVVEAERDTSNSFLLAPGGWDWDSVKGLFGVVLPAVFGWVVLLWLIARVVGWL